MSAAEALRPITRALRDADKRLLVAAGARALVRAGVKVDFASFELPKSDDRGLRAIEQAAANERDAAAGRVREAVAAQMERLQAALALERAATDGAAPPAPAVDDDGADRGEYELEAAPAAGSEDALLAAFAALGRGAHHIEDVRRRFVVLAMLLQQLPQDGNAPEGLVGEILARTREAAGVLADARRAIAGAAYPYEHVDRNVTVADFIIPTPPAVDDVNAVYQAADNAPDTYYTLYMRILSDLCSRAEAVEESLGLEPLPEPKRDEAAEESAAEGA